MQATYLHEHLEGLVQMQTVVHPSHSNCVSICPNRATSMPHRCPFMPPTAEAVHMHEQCLVNDTADANRISLLSQCLPLSMPHTNSAYNCRRFVLHSSGLVVHPVQ